LALLFSLAAAWRNKDVYYSNLYTAEAAIMNRRASWERRRLIQG